MENIGKAWEHLWKWIQESNYEYVCWEKGENGWVNWLEERINLFEKSISD